MKFTLVGKKLWNRRGLIGLVAFLGVLSGSEALRSAEAAVPPIRWPDLIFVFVGLTFGMVFTIGIQVITRNKLGMSSSWAFFFFAAVFSAGAGFSALLIALFRGQAQPAAFLILACSGGMSSGLYLMKPKKDVLWRQK